MLNSYPKIIFMDLEGTLLQTDRRLDNGKVAPSAWTTLAERLGEECLREEEKTKEKWIMGEYPGYVEWMRDTIRIHKEYGLTRIIFEEIINSAKLMPGAKEAIAEFKSRGAITAIISGGFKALADRVQRELKIDHALSGCEYFFNDKTGEVDHYNLLPSDVQGKADFMQLIAKEHGITKDQCVFVGDGKNDVHLAQAVGLSIAFNAQDELKAVATVSIDQQRGKEDFYEVVKTIQSKWKE